MNSWISRGHLRRPWRKTSRSPNFGKSSSHGTIFSNLVKDKDKKTKTTIGWNFSGWRRRPQFIQSLSNSCKYFHKSHPATLVFKIQTHSSYCLRKSPPNITGNSRLGFSTEPLVFFTHIFRCLKMMTMMSSLSIDDGTASMEKYGGRYLPRPQHCHNFTAISSKLSPTNNLQRPINTKYKRNPKENHQLQAKPN